MANSPSADHFRTDLLIDGKWVRSDSGKTVAVENPATEETIAEVAFGTRAETRRALEAAARASEHRRAAARRCTR